MILVLDTYVFLLYLKHDYQDEQDGRAASGLEDSIPGRAFFSRYSIRIHVSWF